MTHFQDLSPRERRQARTSQAILDAARHIIQHEGIDALSMRAIAERIDYSPATLYEYYGGKDEIVAAVCEQGHQLLYQAMTRVDSGLPVLDYVMEIGLVYIRFAVDNPDYFQLMFRSGESGNPVAPPQPSADRQPDTYNGQTLEQAMADNASSFSLLLQGIGRGIAEGVYKPKPGLGLLEMAYGCWSLVHGLATLRIAHGSGFPIDYNQTERQILSQFGRGLSS